MLFERNKLQVRREVVKKKKGTMATYFEDKRHGFVLQKKTKWKVFPVQCRHPSKKYIVRMKQNLYLVTVEKR